jgi:hypothetical protein
MSDKPPEVEIVLLQKEIADKIAPKSETLSRLGKQ